ncbi:hypothetical protein MSAN_02498800 [Mycena sanguinolenta]|uniref:Zn(2)-C6 fungal-type domain-containing protein n=1 Tax=Mycena sanguinolenta TaxID=230812 RepID=A0A8H6WT68_9AGAR|nr:hypothetical protein MSAN_02498800 [Mycena sanguinolenta]
MVQTSLKTRQMWGSYIPPSHITICLEKPSTTHLLEAHNMTALPQLSPLDTMGTQYQQSWHLQTNIFSTPCTPVGSPGPPTGTIQIHLTQFTGLRSEKNMGDARSFSPPFQCCWPSSQLRKDSPRQVPPYDSTTILERNVLPAPAFITFEIPQITPEPRPQTVKFADGRKPRQALACLFCRRRKIPCGRPAAEAADQTCKQCARRDRECVYPTESRRGHHSRVKGNPRQT